MQLRCYYLQRLLYSKLLLQALSALTSAQDACQLSQPLTSYIVHEQPISIKTDVLYNTTFFPIEEVPITVNNAPTSFNGITTLYWTETKTYVGSEYSSSTQSAVETRPAVDESSFVLHVMTSRQLQKRQLGNYWIDQNGTITNDCTTSPIYAIRDGVLTATMNGAVYTFSTAAGVAFAPFVPSVTSESIKTTFSLNNDQILVWQNSTFFNGQASFCGKNLPRRQFSSLLHLASMQPLYPNLIWIPNVEKLTMISNIATVAHPHTTHMVIDAYV